MLWCKFSKDQGDIECLARSDPSILRLSSGPPSILDLIAPENPREALNGVSLENNPHRHRKHG
jgi:hypothetical protein